MASGNVEPMLLSCIAPLVNSPTLFFVTCYQNLVTFVNSPLMLQTLKSFLDEVLPAIPDFVLDSSVVKEATGREDLFADVRRLLPPPYERESQNHPKRGEVCQRDL